MDNQGSGREGARIVTICLLLAASIAFCSSDKQLEQKISEQSTYQIDSTKVYQQTITQPYDGLQIKPYRPLH